MLTALVLQPDHRLAIVANGDAALAQRVINRDALIKYEALPLPQRFRFLHLFQVFQDAPAQVIDIFKATRQ